MTIYSVRVPNAEALTGTPAWSYADLAEILKRRDLVKVTKLADVRSRHIGDGRIVAAAIDDDFLHLDIDIDPELRPMAVPVDGRTYPDAGLGFQRTPDGIRVRHVWLAPTPPGMLMLGTDA